LAKLLCYGHGQRIGADDQDAAWFRFGYAQQACQWATAETCTQHRDDDDRESERDEELGIGIVLRL